MPRYRVPQSLTEAIYRKNQEQINGFIEHKMGLNEARARHPKDKGLPTLPLVQAVRQGDADLVRRLIGAGADPDGAPYLDTPMSVATNTGNVTVSGAGIYGHTGRAVAIDGTLFARNASGFARLDIPRTGRARLAVLRRGRASLAYG